MAYTTDAMRKVSTLSEERYPEQLHLDPTSNRVMRGGFVHYLCLSDMSAKERHEALTGATGDRLESYIDILVSSLRSTTIKGERG